MVSPYNGYLLSFSSAALVVQSAYESIQNVDLNQWRLLQAEYNSKLYNAIKRMQEMDRLMQDQMITNVQTTVNRIFMSPSYLNIQKTANQSLQLVYQMINNSYTDYHWIMSLKMNQPPQPTNATTYYYNCFDCFQTRPRGGKYNYLVAGVP